MCVLLELTGVEMYWKKETGTRCSSSEVQSLLQDLFERVRNAH